MRFDHVAGVVCAAWDFRMYVMRFDHVAGIGRAAWDFRTLAAVDPVASPPSGS
jgi:hypothetical protein